MREIGLFLRAIRSMRCFSLRVACRALDVARGTVEQRDELGCARMA